jgi:hypothetical protein
MLCHVPYMKSVFLSVEGYPIKRKYSCIRLIIVIRKHDENDPWLHSPTYVQYVSLRMI